MKKIIGIVLVIFLLLGGCGREERKPAEFGKTISKGEHMLLITDSNKDTKENEKIDQIARVKDGYISYYNINSNIKIKNIKDKKDNELLKLAKKEDKKAFDESKESFRFDRNLLALKAKENGKSDEKFIEQIDNADKVSYKSPENHKLNIETVIKNKKPIKERVTMSFSSGILSLENNSENIEEYYNKKLKETYEVFFDKRVKTKNIGSDRYSGLQNKQNKILVKLKDNQSSIIFDKETHNNPYISTFNYDDIQKKKR